MFIKKIILLSNYLTYTSLPLQTGYCYTCLMKQNYIKQGQNFA